MKEHRKSLSLISSRIGIFSALYVITGLIPVSLFIGAPSFLALNIIMTPTIAYLLPPMEAFSTSLIGGLISLYLFPTQAMFGPLTILLPIAGATLGSLSIHKGKTGRLISSIFLISSMLAYLIVNYPFPYFIAPHTLALIILIVSIFKELTPLKYQVPLYTFASTMCEQGMMMIFAVHLLQLPWQVFTGVLPIMIYERALGTIGSSLIIFALIKSNLTLLQN